MLGIIFPITTLILRLFGFLIVNLDDLLRMTISGKRALEGGAGIQPILYFFLMYVLTDLLIEFRDHMPIFHQYLFELIPRVVVQLPYEKSTIFVKSINFMPLSYLSLKKLNNFLIFSR